MGCASSTATNSANAETRSGPGRTRREPRGSSVESVQSLER
jgi:hypothetical protein